MRAAPEDVAAPVWGRGTSTHADNHNKPGERVAADRLALKQAQARQGVDNQGSADV